MRTSQRGRHEEAPMGDDDMDIGPAPWPEQMQYDGQQQQQKMGARGGDDAVAAHSSFSSSTMSSSTQDNPNTTTTINNKRRLPLAARARALFHPAHGKLRPFRLLREDWASLRGRWASDWTVVNQLVLASAVYVFFTNILPGITFASDLYVLTGQSWGTIEVVFSTGLCGLVFSLLAAQPLCILGVTGPFSVLAENIYKLCTETFDVSFVFSLV